ncbi:MAG: restriction endonuclease subunit S [Terricaulis sp.]|nr:restriction endonuclease subunit S [Terricaulis sp.]
MIGVREKPLAEVADVIRGVTYSAPDASSEPLPGSVPLLRAGNIKAELTIDDDLVFVPERLINDRQWLRRGDIVMCTSSGSSAVVGKTAYLEKDWRGSFGAFCAVIRSRSDECHPRYLYHYLQSPKFRAWADRSAGANIKNIRKSELDDFPLILPKAKEQERIAAILDKADAIRRKREQALALADELLKSTFLDMFGDPVRNPKGWRRRPVGELCSRVTVGIVVQPASYYVSHGVPALRSLNVREDYIDRSNLVYFSPEDNERELAKTRIRAGDVVVVRSGQPGKAAIVPPELDGVNSIDILIASPKLGEVTSDYLCAFLNSPGGREIVLAEERGQIQKHLNVGSLKAAEIPTPPFDLMAIHERRVHSMRDQRTLLASAQREADGLFASLCQRAFRGEL